MRPDGLAAFCDRSENPVRLRDQLTRFLEAGSVQPGWCWTATGAGGAVLARHYWWGRPGSGTPIIVTSVSTEDPGAAAGLLVHARDQLGVTEARCEVVVPREQADDPSAARPGLVAVLTRTGFGLLVRRVRVEWTPASGAPPPGGRLVMRPAREFGEQALLTLFRAVGDGSLDHGMTSGRARLGEAAEARERLAAVRAFPAEPGWFTVGLTAGGDLAGYVAPGYAGAMPVVAEIGVAAAHRGHHYVDDLLAHATRVLAAAGPDRIRADTDLANRPMRAAFARAGYQEFAWRDDYAWRREDSPAARTGPVTGQPARAGTLTTQRLRLVPLTVSDADEMVGVLAGSALYVFTGGTAPGAEELRARYGRLVAGRSPDGTQIWHNWIVRTLAGTAVGTIQATVVDRGARAEVAWVTGEQHWGRGYATEAATAVIGWLAETGVSEVLAHIHPGHSASQAVAWRAGLRPADVISNGEQRWIRRFGRSG
jgi:RimJ/RimL family protein N-acetyltransferase